MAGKAKQPKVKCDFDKESMYQRIMPTGTKKEENEVEDNPYEEYNKAMNAATVRNVKKENKRVEIYSTTGITITQQVKPTILINITEYAVNQKINDAFNKFKCCKCDRCMKDVAAIALNRLPCHYVVAEEDTLPKLMEETVADVVPAIVSAIMQVKANPRH